MQPILELKNVDKTYQMDEVKLKVLKNINLSIKKGEFLVIQGQSGSGKSTILHIAGLLDKPTKGSVFFNGNDVSEFDDGNLARIRREEIGFVFQFFYLVPSLTALENVTLPMMLDGVPEDKRIKRAEELLRMIGLGKRMYNKQSQLSGGERQRVAIARAMANNPKVIFADEPTGNLDSKSGKDILKFLINLNKKGVTIVMVTHDQKLASRSERIIILKDGVIIKESKRK